MGRRPANLEPGPADIDKALTRIWRNRPTDPGEGIPLAMGQLADRVRDQLRELAAGGRPSPADVARAMRAEADAIDPPPPGN